METKEATKYDSLEACVLHEMGRWTVPGMVVGVFQDGRMETHGFGVASLRTRQPATPETLFQNGSIGKVYTTTLVMTLVEEGKLDLDTPVMEYLPDLKLADEEAQRTITLRHLLTHTSGLEGDSFKSYGWGDDALAKAIAEFDQLRQITRPGELWTYCNAGFYLAGRVVEKVTDKTFEAAMGERVFAPLGMERSVYFAEEAIVHPVAVGHERKKPESAPTVAGGWGLMRSVHAAGGVKSTVGDLLRFGAMHLGGGGLDGKRVLSERSVQQMQEPQTEAANFADAYGLGWALRTVRGERIVEHGGATNGFRAQLTLVPDKGFAIAMQSNGDRGAAAQEAIERWALDHYRGLAHEDPEPIELSPKQLDVFVGRYERPHAKMTFARHDGGLRAEVSAVDLESGEERPLPAIAMVPIGPREFFVPSGDYAGLRTDFVPGEGETPRFVRFGGRLADRVDD